MTDMRRRLDLDSTGFVRGVENAAHAMERLANLSNTMWTGLDKWARSADKPASEYARNMAVAVQKVRQYEQSLAQLNKVHRESIGLSKLSASERNKALRASGMSRAEYDALEKQAQSGADALNKPASFRKLSKARQQDRNANLRGLYQSNQERTDAAIGELTGLMGPAAKAQGALPNLYAQRKRVRDLQQETEKLAGQLTSPGGKQGSKAEARGRELQQLNEQLARATATLVRMEEETIGIVAARTEAERRALAAAEAQAFYGESLAKLSATEQAKTKAEMAEAIYRGSKAVQQTPQAYMEGLKEGKYVDASSTATDRVIRQQQAAAKLEQAREKERLAAANQQQAAAAEALAKAEKERLDIATAQINAERRALAAAEAQAFYGESLKNLSATQQMKLKTEMAEAIYRGSEKTKLTPKAYMEGLQRGENIDASSTATDRVIRQQQDREKQQQAALRARRLQQARGAKFYDAEISNISDPDKQLAAITAVRKLEEAYADSTMTAKQFKEAIDQIRDGNRDTIKDFPALAAHMQALRKAMQTPDDPNEARKRYTKEMRERMRLFEAQDAQGDILGRNMPQTTEPEHVMRLQLARQNVYHAMAKARRTSVVNGKEVEEGLDPKEYGALIKKIRSGNGEAIQSFGGVAQAVMQFDSAVTAARHSAGRWMEDWNNWYRLVSARVLTFAFYNLIAAMRQSVSEAIEVSRGIGEIMSITQGMPQVTKDWERAIYRIAHAYNFAVGDTTEALYQAISNQVAQGSNVISFLETSAQFAKATKSTLTQSVDLLSAAVNAFGYDARETEHIAAVLFRTIELGRVRTEDMANTFGRVAATASLAGVTFEDLGAAIAQITVRGVKYERASTFIINVLNKMMKPSKQMQQIFADMGVTSGEALIKIHGLTGVIELLAQRVGHSASEVAEMFKDIRAVGGISLLTQDAEKLRQVTEQLSKSTVYYNNAKSQIVETSGERLAKDLNMMRTGFVGLAHSIMEATYAFTDFFHITTKDTGTALGPGFMAAFFGGSALLGQSLLRKRFPIGPAAGTLSAALRGKGFLGKLGVGAVGATIGLGVAKGTGMFGEDPYVSKQRDELKRIANLLGQTHEAELEALTQRTREQTQQNQDLLLKYRLAAADEKRALDREFAERKRYYDTIAAYYTNMAQHAGRLLRTEQDAGIAGAIDPSERNAAQYQAIMTRMNMAQRDPARAAEYQQQGVGELVELYSTITQNIGDLTRQQREATDWTRKSPMDLAQKQQAWMQWWQRTPEDRMMNWTQRPELQEEWQYGRNEQMLRVQQEQAAYVREELSKLGLSDDLLAEKMNYEQQGRSWDEYVAEFTELHKYITEKLVDDDFARVVTMPILEQLRKGDTYQRGVYDTEMGSGFADRTLQLIDQNAAGRTEVRRIQEELDSRYTQLNSGQGQLGAYGMGINEAERLLKFGGASDETATAIRAEIAAMREYLPKVTAEDVYGGKFAEQTAAHQRKLEELFDRMRNEITLNNETRGAAFAREVLASQLFPYRNNAVPVPGAMAKGGPVGTDTVPAWLTPGEFVVNRKATEAYRPFLESINRYADGGWVRKTRNGRDYYVNKETGAISNISPLASARYAGHPIVGKQLYTSFGADGVKKISNISPYAGASYAGHELTRRADLRYLSTGRNQVSSFSNVRSDEDQAAAREFDRRKAIRERKRMESQVISDIIQGLRGKPADPAQARKRANLQAQMALLQQEGGRLKQTADARSAIYNQAAWGLGGAAVGATALFAAPAILAGLGSMGFAGGGTGLGAAGTAALANAAPAVRALHQAQQARKWGQTINPFKELVNMGGYDWLRPYVASGAQTIADAPIVLSAANVSTRGSKVWTWLKRLGWLALLGGEAKSALSNYQPAQNAPGFAKGGLVNNYTINAPITLNGSGATALDVRNMVTSLNREIARGAVRVRS